MMSFRAAALGLLALSCVSASPPDAKAPPAAVYAKLDGRWKGLFVGYDTTGKELYRIEVEQTYKTIDATTQTVRIRDKDLKTGKVVTGNGKNVAVRRADGTVVLTCIVDKDNGDHVEHQGRLITGPDGDTQLVWYSVSKDRSETFREVVSGEGSGAVYTIDGMGRYGDTLILMHGRYHRAP